MTTLPDPIPALAKTDAELLRWYQCGRKLVYEDGQSALAMAVSITCSSPITQYKCRFCYGWHVGKVSTRLNNHRRQLRRATRSWLRYGQLDAGIVVAEVVEILPEVVAVTDSAQELSLRVA